jgi:hypothetical protein
MFLSKLTLLKQTKLTAVARVAAYIGFVGVAGATLSVSKAKADITEQAFVLGRDLSQIAEFVDHTYQIRMNGETIFMASTESSLPRKEIVDRFEDVCRNNPGVIADAWKAIPKKSDAKGGDGSFLTRLGVMRKDTKDESLVACLARSDQSAGSLKESFKKFEQSGDIGYVGKLRYAYIKGPTPSGKFDITTLWTENSFNIYKFMGDAEGDVPGTDSPTVGRPVSSKRLLSAEIVGTPYAIRMYSSDAQKEAILGKFDKDMYDNDWLVFNQYGDTAHVYFKDGVETIVSVVRDEMGKQVVSVGEFGGDRLIEK